MLFTAMDHMLLGLPQAAKKRAVKPKKPTSLILVQLFNLTPVSIAMAFVLPGRVEESATPTLATCKGIVVNLAVLQNVNLLSLSEIRFLIQHPIPNSGKPSKATTCTPAKL